MCYQPTLVDFPVIGLLITGSLPSGLSLDFLTGEISGTPDTVTPNAQLPSTPTNAGGYGK